MTTPGAQVDSSTSTRFSLSGIVRVMLTDLNEKCPIRNPVALAMKATNEEDVGDKRQRSLRDLMPKVTWLFRPILKPFYQARFVTSGQRFAPIVRNYDA